MSTRYFFFFSFSPVYFEFVHMYVHYDTSFVLLCTFLLQNARPLARDYRCATRRTVVHVLVLLYVGHVVVSKLCAFLTKRWVMIVCVPRCSIMVLMVFMVVHRFAGFSLYMDGIVCTVGRGSRICFFLGGGEGRL